MEDTIKIIQGLASHYEEHHGVTYSKEAIRTAAELAAKHINDRFLPDKAIDVIDEVGAAIRLIPVEERPSREITPLDVELVVLRVSQKSRQNQSRALTRNASKSWKLSLSQ